MSDDSSSADTDECVQMWLGGLPRGDLNAMAWDDESVGSHGGLSPLKTEPLTDCSTKSLDLEPFQVATLSETQQAVKLAYRIVDDRLEPPPVQVVAFADRGRGLVATAPIAKNAVIAVEQALVAVQLRPMVRGCQCCFRSLEPMSALGANLPRPDLWPVAEMDWSSETSTVDHRGRFQCRWCDAWFCSRACLKRLQTQLGSCCALRKAAAVVEDQDPAVGLATRMFAMELQQYRTTGSLDGSPLELLCGHANDLTMLEIGTANDSGPYTLDDIYAKLIDIWSMTDEEQAVLTSQHFGTLAAAAARNGVNLTTQSPFAVYYAALVHAMGRGSDRHEQIKSEIAQALGAQDGKLARGMDRLADFRVAVDTIGIYSMVAMVNHDCDPNAQIIGQQFVDAHLELVARRDIGIGEQMTISYIGYGPGMGHKSTERRQRELQAKYLFTCRCSLCLK